MPAKPKKTAKKRKNLLSKALDLIIKPLPKRDGDAGSGFRNANKQLDELDKRRGK